MRDPLIDDTGSIDGDYDDVDDLETGAQWRKSNRERKHGNRRRRPSLETEKQRDKRGPRKPERVESRDGTFRCRYCKTLVGIPLSGGRHRNHCPLCLYSRHVDLKSPGDRRSDCRSLMEAIGLYARPNGEQVLIHACRGCGVIRHNRVAADDNVVQVMRLPIVDPALSQYSVGITERTA